MATTASTCRITQRRDTTDNWIKANPIPSAGEICLMMDNGEYTHMVIGDGKRSFKDLPKIKFNIDKFIKEPACTYEIPVAPLIEEYFIF